MKSLLKNVLRRISKKQSSKEDNATAFYPQCCAKVDDSARMRIKMSYDQNVKETISSLKTLANDMSSGFVTFKKFQTRRYQYNPDADATLYASRLLRAASILEFLLTDPDNKSYRFIFSARAESPISSSVIFLAFPTTSSTFAAVSGLNSFSNRSSCI